MKASATFEASPMPSQMTNSRARMTRGTAFSNVMTGWSSSVLLHQRLDDPGIYDVPAGASGMTR